MHTVVLKFFMNKDDDDDDDDALYSFNCSLGFHATNMR